MSGGGTVYPLQGNQKDAVDPRDSVWLSASAGTGKTQVLSARVLRLLLRHDVRPEQMLCLTFTKAGAAEMATRVNAVLARWVRMKDEVLGADLLAIGAKNTPENREKARTLFASVLDCPGGGLRIDTIHAFAQYLLSAFPIEANIAPGTRPMEDRDRELLTHRVLEELVGDWEKRGDANSIAALEDLSIRMGADGARDWMLRCAQMRAAFFGPGALQPPMRPRIESLLGLPENARIEDLAHLCSDAEFDITALMHWHGVLSQWGTKTAFDCTEAIENWRALDEEARLLGLADLVAALFTQKGDVRALATLEKIDPGIAATAEGLRADIEAIAAQRTLVELLDLITPALTIGRQFARAWDKAKQREGLVDFDDLIRQAAELLGTAGLGEWIRYKLDRRFDHILIDEAQDTNEAQWAIVDALTGDFFTGLGQRDGKLRTIFVVGDYKQAIFRFQGTSPENFASARNRYRQQMAERAANAAQLQLNIEARELVELGLGRSYRTAQDVLTFVDNAIEAIGRERFGRIDREQHVGDAGRPGLVTLWQPVAVRERDEQEEKDADSWLSAPERDMADNIARQVKQWMDEGFRLVKGGKRNATPGDVMVLVRKRRELAGLVVARLHAAGVPVAGVDRLRLGAPLAVKDLIAALRFAAQPADSLSLASLLVSPIFGWSQEQLLQHGYREQGVPLWDHLRDSTAEEVQQSVDKLRELLRIADFEPPQAMLHWMLVGPWRARSKLIARLGREAADPIDELLNAALAYSASHTSSLQGFLQWFAAGDGELKRDAEGAGGQVRVMTVHGSKGLQAPIVILADACGNPDTSPTRGLALEEQLPGGRGRTIPLPDLRKEEKVGPIREVEEAEQAAEREEHWRLLYVAMTRAEEALFIGGALGKREQEPAEDSWYAQLAPLFDGQELADPIWGMRKEIGSRADPVVGKDDTTPDKSVELPAWATTPIGPEPRPPRPLAPSSAGEDYGADPPLPPEIAASAARRGVLMHSLLERLPSVAASQREEQGRHWLARQAPDLPENEREDMLARALAVIAEPGWAEIFGTDALAEVPLAAIVDGQVIAGMADRLLVTPEKVRVVDFKTARRPPSSLAEMPDGIVKQMGAYAAALEVIFPGRAVEAAVLYTQTPQLIAIPGEILAANKPRLAPVE